MGATNWSLWRDSDVRLLIGGTTINEIGDWLLELALPVYVFIETGSGLTTAGIYLVGLLARVLFGPLGGSLADRWTLRTTLIATNLGQVGALAPLLIANPDKTWPIYLVVLLQGIISSVNDPASFALLPRIVPDEHLVRANSAMSAGGSIARLIGAAAGGFAVAAGGLVTVVLAVAATFILAAIAASLMSSSADRSQNSKVASDGTDASIRAGLSEIRSRPTVTALVWIHGLAMVVFGGFPLLFIAFVTNYLDGGGTEVGIIRASSAFGGLAAAAVIGSFVTRYHSAHVMAGGYLSFAVVAFMFVNAPSVTTTLWVYLVLFAMTGFPNVASEVGTISTAQLLCPPAVLGRLGGLMTATTALGKGLGSITAGLLLESFTARTLFNSHVAIFAVCGLATVLFVIRPVRASENAAFDPQEEPTT